MPHPHKNFVRLIALAAAAAVVTLAGCATPSAPVSAPTADASTTPVEPEPTAETPTGSACLVGDWYIAQGQLQAFYDGLGAANGKLDFTIKGGTGLSFTASTFRYTPDFTLLVAISGIDASGKITGSIDGNYTADSDTITTSQETNSTKLDVVVGGVAQDGSGLFDSILAKAPISKAPYECTETGPLIQFSTGTGSVPVQLTAAG
ncbi:MAG: hypothetical protein ACOH1T_05515 [Microbacteriaceae bacterium]